MKRPDKTRWEEDYELIEGEGLFDEYLEMGELLVESGSSVWELRFNHVSKALDRRCK